MVGQASIKRCMAFSGPSSSRWVRSTGTTTPTLVRAGANGMYQNQPCSNVTLRMLPDIGGGSLSPPSKYPNSAKLRNLSAHIRSPHIR